MSEYKSKTKKLKDQSKRVGLDNTADIKRIHKSLADVYIKIEQSLKDKNTKATKENTKHFLELSKNIVALNKIFEDGLTINNLSDIKQAETIIVKNLKDIPRDVTVNNQTEIPRWLASDESVKSLNESVEKVVSQLVDLEATIKPSQNPDKFIPMRRVIRQGNNLIYDDSDWSSHGGGGGGFSGTGQHLMADSAPVVIASDQTSVPVTSTPVSNNVTTGTITANGGTVVATVIDSMAGWTMAYQGTYSTGASLTMEASFDGGTTYNTVRMLAGITSTLGYVLTIAAGVNGSSYYTADIPTGATHIRVRCSAWAAPTGTINVTIGQSAERFSTPPGAIVLTSGTVTTVSTLTNITNWGNIVDNAAFTDGTTRLMPGGYIFDEVAGTALTENDAAAARIDSKRAQVVTLEDATTRGQRLAITAGGAMATTPVNFSSTTNSNVAGSATSVQLAAANTSRKELTIQNDSSAILYIKEGTTASATDYKYKLYQDDIYITNNYTGRVDGIWASATGAARVAES